MDARSTDCGRGAGETVGAAKKYQSGKDSGNTGARLLVLRQQESFERRQDALRGFQQDGVF